MGERRILLFGGSGQVGGAIRALRLPDGVTLVAPGRDQADIVDRAAVDAVLGSEPWTAVINTAAWTAVDAAEDAVAGAFAANALGPAVLADATRERGIPLVHYSTDYVFDGTKDSPYLEWDQTNPQSVYGRTKLAGERELDPGSTIMRTSWVCGYHGNNMVKTILRLAGEHDTLTFVDDQRGHPTFAADLAVGIKRLVVDRRPGTFHLTNQGAVSWFEFAQAVLEASGQDPERVKPVKTVDLQQNYPAPRPANSVLDNAALRLSGVPLLDDFRVPLRRLVERLGS